MEREEGGRVRGASTISQQVAKNLFLWPDRSFVREGFRGVLHGADRGGSGRSGGSSKCTSTSPSSVPASTASARRARRSSASRPRGSAPDEAALLAAVLPSPRRLHADRPSAYVLERRDWILRQMNRPRRAGLPARDVSARLVLAAQGGYSARPYDEPESPAQCRGRVARTPARGQRALRRRAARAPASGRGASRLAEHRPAPDRGDPRLRRLARAARDRLRSGDRRFVHPARRGERRRRRDARQPRVRGRASRGPADRRPRPLALRRGGGVTRGRRAEGASARDHRRRSVRRSRRRAARRAIIKQMPRSRMRAPWPSECAGRGR